MRILKIGVLQTLQKWRAGDAAQARRLGNIARLFAGLLVLTLIARGTSAATMPVVTTQAPAAAQLAKTFQGGATITASAGQPFLLPSGLLITAVPVREGQQVAEGTPLVYFDADELELTLARAKAELAQLKLQYQKGMQAVEADPQAVEQSQKQLQSAYDALEAARRQGEADVSAAAAALEQANAGLPPLQAAYDAALETWSAKWKESWPDTPLPDPLPGEPEKWQAFEAETNALLAAQEDLGKAQAAAAAAEAALTAARTTAEASEKNALAAVQSAEDSRDTALHSYEDQKKNAEEATATNRAAAAITKTNITAQEQEIARLEAAKAAGCSYCAPYAGTLTGFALAPGNTSPGIGGLLAPASGSCDLVFDIPPEWAGHVTAGSMVTVTQGGRSAEVAIEMLDPPDESGAVQARLALAPGDGWQPGSANVSMRVELGRYAACLPPAALHGDSNGSFVYLVEERDTVLGRENVLVRVPVTVVQTSDGLTAVSGALGGGDAVVVGADRPLTAGARVRFEKGDV